MSGHDKMEVQKLILAGNTSLLLEKHKSLRASGKNEVASYLLRTAHLENKARLRAH